MISQEDTLLRINGVQPTLRWGASQRGGTRPLDVKIDFYTRIYPFTCITRIT